MAALGGLGIRDSVVLNLPDLGRAPNYALFQPELAGQASRATRTFNRRLGNRVAKLNDAGLNVREIDIKAAFDDVLENPEDHGVSDAVTPCVFPQQAGGSVYSPAEALARAFFDPIHPNSVLHAEIATVVSGEIAPVPLPAPAALLLAAVGLLAYQRRTRRPSAAPSPVTMRIASAYQTA